MFAQSQFHNSVTQNGTAVIGDNQLLFDPADWIFGDVDGLSLASIWSNVDDGGTTQAPTSHSVDLTVDAMAPSLQLGALDGYTADLAGGGGDDGAGHLTTYTGHSSIDNHIDAFNFQIDDATPIDRPQYQLASLSFDGSEGNSSAAGGLGIVEIANPQAQPFQTLDSPADAMGPAFAPDVFAGSIADAKGGGGGGHPGGGGGGDGGGSGLLTTYTSGDSSVADVSEFNIQVNFSGSWTVQEQAVVTWAADLWSKIITADVRDDTDLNGNPVDDIVISMSTGRIDGAGNPLTGDILAQTQITAVRDPGSIDQWLPVTASIKLDSTDLKNSIADGWSGTWDSIIMHEMGHTLGFAGIVFDNLGLVDSFGNFIGPEAMLAYGGPVPLENDGGSGTAGSHWDETGFAPNGVQMSNELMTGWLNKNEQTFLSDTTVGALADLGYNVQDPSVGSSYLVIDNHLLLA